MCQEKNNSLCYLIKKVAFLVDNRNIILKRILDLIDKREWSKKKFAEICKIHPQHVNSYLDGTFGFENLLEGLANEGEDVFYILTGTTINSGVTTMGEFKDKQEKYSAEYLELKAEIKKLTSKIEQLETQNNINKNLLALLLKENLSLEAKNMVLSVLNSQIEDPKSTTLEAPP